MIDALVPYVLTTAENSKYLNFEGIDACQILDIADRRNRDFCDLLNHTNQLAFGGPTSMGMPKWVMLDCAILASAMIGFMLPIEHVDAKLKAKLNIDPSYSGPVPISEYSASFTARPNCVSGFSLQTQIESLGIGTRTKALALAILNANRQIGVTQFDSTAIRTHCKFGPLKLEIHQPIVHTYPERSFVYSVDLPDRDQLIQMSRGEVFAQEEPENPFWFEVVNPKHHQKLADHLEGDGEAWIVTPGFRLGEKGRSIPILFI